ncbi:hypothetical protein [Aeromicrobium marinum]|nr:hypothetical protein [Aeromicrobium marinum]
MPRRPCIPDALMVRPFTRGEALALGLTARQLQGREFRQLFPRVWVWTGLAMSELDWIVAADLSMPDHAHLSHATRLHRLGLDVGPRRPLHFTAVGDLHRTHDDIFLHRAVVLPPPDEHGVTPTAAFIGLASTARVLDLVVAGDWLLHHGHMTLPGLRELARHHDWRPGAAAAAAVTTHLDGRSRSPKESESRAVVRFAGLPDPVVNARLDDDPAGPIGDLWWPRWRTVLEYEGRQHIGDVGQFNTDIARYAWMRRHDVAYLQVTHEMLRHPRALATAVHQLLRTRGYPGLAPVFGDHWDSLFQPSRRPTSRRHPHSVGGR